MHTSTFLTLIFSLSSLLFAGLTLIYVVKDYNRNKFKISLYTSKITEINSKEDYIMLKITNSGRRYVHISAIGYKGVEKNKFWLVANQPGGKNLPIKLGEGECYINTYNYKELIVSLNGEKLIGFHIEDSLGGKYIVKFDKKYFPEIT